MQNNTSNTPYALLFHTLQITKEAMEQILACRASDGTKCVPNDEDFTNLEKAIELIDKTYEELKS